MGDSVVFAKTWSYSSLKWWWNLIAGESLISYWRQMLAVVNVALVALRITADSSFESIHTRVVKSKIMRSAFH